jgi:hypothetical protein
MIGKWHDLFMVTAGVSGTLLGLIFVALSISIVKIMSVHNLPKIALQPINLLLVILIISIFMLVPEQHISSVGIEVLAAGILIWLYTTTSDISIYKGIRKADKKKDFIANLIFSQLTTLPTIISGIAILSIGEAGVYWLIPSIIFSFVKVILSAWALLIEINH